MTSGYSILPEWSILTDSVESMERTRTAEPLFFVDANYFAGVIGISIGISDKVEFRMTLVRRMPGEKFDIRGT